MRSTGSASEVIVPDSISDLQTQLAHLKWRKVSNDNKIRNKIATSKSLVERDLLLALSQKCRARSARTPEVESFFRRGVHVRARRVRCEARRRVPKVK